MYDLSMHQISVTEHLQAIVKAIHKIYTRTNVNFSCWSLKSILSNIIPYLRNDRGKE